MSPFHNFLAFLFLSKVFLDIFICFFRRKALNLALELEDIKRSVTSIAISHPQISFTLRNETTGEKLIQSYKTSSIKESFVQLHSEIDEDNLKECFHQNENGYKIHGYVSVKGFRGKQFQYVFVNKRLLKRSSVMKQLNSEFKVLRSQKLYAAFVMYIECPLKSVDIAVEPRRVEAIFESPEIVNALIHQGMSSFLEKHASVTSNTFSQEEMGMKSIREVNHRQYLGQHPQVESCLPDISGIEPIKRRERERKNSLLDGFQGHSSKYVSALNAQMSHVF